jgi:hypothetical protein
MKKLYANKIVEVFWDDFKDIIIYTWFPASNDISDEEYQRELTAFTHEIRRYGVRGILVDLSKRDYVVNNRLQEWVGGEIIPQWFLCGVERLAIVVPNELIPRLSVELSLMEAEQKLRSTFHIVRYFGSIEIAKEWM